MNSLSIYLYFDYLYQPILYIRIHLKVFEVSFPALRNFADSYLKPLNEFCVQINLREKNLILM